MTITEQVQTEETVAIEETFAAFWATMRGPVLVSDEAGNDEAHKVWNSTIDGRRPSSRY